jgi:sugar lactone lactonase YvrE
MPDGLAVDDDGALWVGMWGGGAVHRYAPAGSLDRAVRLPAAHVTACCFGGASGDTLFVTTAAPRPSAEPHAGALFALRPGVTGPAATPLADQLVGPPA